MAGWHQTMIIGNVGRDPETRTVGDGKMVCNFTVAVTVGKRDDPQAKTTWYKVTCWERLAEIANQYVRKGTQIFISGTVNVSAYTDKNGKPAATLELTARDFQLLGGRPDGQEQGQQPPVSSGSTRSSGGGGAAYSGNTTYDPYADFSPPPSNEGDIPF